MEKFKLKPVTMRVSRYKRNYQNTTQQMFLLKALKITQDPKKLKEIIGVKTVAEVYRTLDKMAMRKVYHESLTRAGISFDYITKGIKTIADSAKKADTRLKAFQTLLKSVGMETYDVDSQGVNGTWEDTLLKKIEEEKNEEIETYGPIKYSVTIPEIPESERLHQLEEEEITGSVYDTKK